MSLSIKLWLDTSLHVPLQPEWTIKESEGKIFNLNRVPTGNHTIYTYATFYEWRIPLKFVPEYYAYLINYYHRVAYGTSLGGKVLLETIEGGTSQVYSAMIMNKTSPMNQVVKPDIAYWQGELLLSEY